MDLLGQGPPTDKRLRNIVQEAMEVDVPEDGMIYDPDTLESTGIAETAEYNGVCKLPHDETAENALIKQPVEVQTEHHQPETGITKETGSSGYRHGRPACI